MILSIALAMSQEPLTNAVDVRFLVSRNSTEPKNALRDLEIEGYAPIPMSATGLGPFVR